MSHSILYPQLLLKWVVHTQSSSSSSYMSFIKLLVDPADQQADLTRPLAMQTLDPVQGTRQEMHRGTFGTAPIPRLRPHVL